MEGDDLSNSKQFETKLGLQRGVSRNSLRPRAKKMEGEAKKYGDKERMKPFEIPLNSEDDEPIGSLLKLKRPRNPKKAKVVLGKPEAKEEKLVVEDEDFGGMDDTLASYRKKLKGPKKDIGSVNLKLLDDSMDKGHYEGDGVVDGVGNKPKERVNKAKVDAGGKRIGCDAVVDDDSEGLGFHGALLEDQKEGFLLLREGSSLYLDQKLEGSLSALSLKCQSGSTKKDRMNQQNSSAQTFKDELCPILEGVSGVSKSVDTRGPRLEFASDVVCEGSMAEDSTYAVSGLSPSKIVKKESFDNGFCEASNCMEENTDTIGRLSSIPAITDDSTGTNNNRHGRPSGKFSEILPSITTSSVSNFGGIRDDYTEDPAVSTVKGGHMAYTYSSNGVCNEKCPDSIKMDGSETQTLKNGFKISSVSGMGTLVHDVVKMHCNSASKQNSLHLLKMDESSKTENELDMDCHQNASHHTCSQVRSSAFVSPKTGENWSDCGSLNGDNKEPDLASDSRQKENAATSDGRLSPVTAMSDEVHKSGFTFQLNYRGNFEETCGHPNESSASIKKCISVLQRNQLSDDATKGTCVLSHDYRSTNKEANEGSPTSISPEENDSCPEDAVSMPDSEIKDGKLSTLQRVLRRPKKRRYGDMAYEGDADWEILINEQRFLESSPVVDSDRYLRMREKTDSSSVSVTEVENCETAAVSAGLKARAVGPVEKIKFKEVLKRKGGLQEYLECRNQILGLWSKDVSRILPLVDCGVTDTPSEDESLRASLIREIYSFLDQSGYINVGVASHKEKAEPSAKHNYKLFEGKDFMGNPGASVADIEDGVSFILGRVRSSETSLEEKNVAIDDENAASKATKSTELELSNSAEHEECPADDIRQTGTANSKSSNRLVNLGVLNAEPSCTILDCGTVPVITPETGNDLQSVRPSSSANTVQSHNFQRGSEDRKKIIVIGAGPAGLTAAQHLQRQGFCVTVLEARSRIGGRVYTDHSSLSVPVDLGASIITGVEADVATERRPDPSSLICAQLGLELTVLNSACPLYDIVAGEKVPTDLDEALEEEYNSLLDDMVLIVAQKGEHAMKMSLEDGLEYALKKRRMARSGIDIDETELRYVYDSKTCGIDGVPEESYSREDVLSPLERRVMNWHFAHLEYGCAALLKEVSLPYWNQDDVYGGFGGAHCMIKGGYSNVIDSLGEGLLIHLNHVVSDISYGTKETGASESQCHKVKVSTSNGSQFFGHAVLITVPLGCLKAETMKFFPPLPPWKRSSIQRLGYGVLNKVALEFPEVFWDDSVDYFGATAEEIDRRGHCFMFWNVRKTVGAPVLIALVVGRAAIDGQNMSSSDHVSHALMVLRKLFGEASVPDPVASVVTDWGRDPFSYGAYSYVAIGSSGEDYDILGRPVENCLFFAGEATCKEHPDTVGGAMMSGLREAVRIINILSTGHDHTAEVEAMEAAERHSEFERDEVRDITKRLEAVEISNVLYKNSLDGARIFTRKDLLQDMFFSAKTTLGRLHLAKELLKLPVEFLKSFAGTRKGLTTLNSWILDSMGKDGTQLLRHCVRLLVLVSTDLLAVRLSGIGKTVKEKVCVHTSRDIRAIASQLVSVWLEVFRREKASNGGLKLSRQAIAMDSSRRKSLCNPALGKPPLRNHHGAMENKGSLQAPASIGSPLNSDTDMKKMNGKLEAVKFSKWESRSHPSQGRPDTAVDRDNTAMSKEEQVAVAAAEAACAAARAAAEAYASSEAKFNTLLQLPKIPSFHKFARREQYAQMDEYDLRRKWSGGVIGRQDCISEIDSRNCRVRDWSVDFSTACPNLDCSRMSVDNVSQRSHSNEIVCHMNFREQSGESAAVDSSLFTKAWVDSAGGVGVKDYHAIERWQSQAAAADSDFFNPVMDIRDEEDSNTSSKPPARKNGGRANESSISQVTVNKEPVKDHPRGADRIKQAVVDFVASLLMPVYKARKVDREGYKSIMKKTATKVMEQATDAEKTMAVSEFLDSKRKNKIRAFVDKLIEKHMAMRPAAKP